MAGVNGTEERRAATRRARWWRLSGPLRSGTVERTGQMVRKELLQTLRDARLRRMLILAPLVQLIVFGYAVSTDLRQTKTIVVDQDRTSASRELIEAFQASGYFRVVGWSDRPGAIVEALDRGRAVLGLQIPPVFARDAARGEARVQILIDGTNSNTATLAQSYAMRIVGQYGASIARGGGGAGVRALATPGVGQAAVAIPSLDLRERAWFNPGLVSRNYNVPAVAGFITLLFCLLLTSLAVVRERELGTLEQLRVTPLRPSELIAGKTIPFGLIGLLDLALVLAVAILWFGIPFRGSFLLLLGGSVLFLVSALGMGLLVSTLASTQQEAFIVTFLILMPTILLSGFLFPVKSMPLVFQWATLLIPLRHYLDVVRGVFLKGAGFRVLWPQLLALAVMGVAFLGIAVARFRKQTG
ncbi:MAG: ABC transporter permease [Candidatus Eisenbacteria bacterium]|nr:ABC transporter permease [Candidatus Eisenbacteria bacterium]